MKFGKPRVVVFDTSALIGAVLRPKSLPAQALQKASVECHIAASDETLRELVEVLGRDKFDAYCSREGRIAFLEMYLALVIIHSVTATATECRDPKDNKFLSLAISAEAAAIVSSDDDLRVLHPYHDVAILSPAAFLET